VRYTASQALYDIVLLMLYFIRTQTAIIVASLNNHPFGSGYTIESSQLGNSGWKEIFNSDTELYGGNNVGNFGATIPCTNGRIDVVIPANGFVVLQKAL